MHGISRAEYVPPSSAQTSSTSKLTASPRHSATLPLRPEVSTATISIVRRRGPCLPLTQAAHRRHWPGVQKRSGARRRRSLFHWISAAFLPLSGVPQCQRGRSHAGPHDAGLHRVSPGTSQSQNRAKSAPATRCGSRRRAPSPAALFQPRRFLRASRSARASRRTFWLPPATSPQPQDDQFASCSLTQLSYDLFHQRIWIAFVFGNFGGDAIDLAVAKVIAHNASEERVPQHFCDALAPVLDPPPAPEIVPAQMSAVTLDGLQHVRDASPVTGNSLHDRGSPVVLAHGQRLHRPDFALNTFGPVAVRFVDHEDVGDLHDSGLDGLHIVS